uniref:Uncharacterized protein n=1 Tax=Anguilla anguilla TaxID=7936 RepID=A0A0E9U1M9_ANGAN
MFIHLFIVIFISTL